MCIWVGSKQDVEMGATVMEALGGCDFSNIKFSVCIYNFLEECFNILEGFYRL